MAAGRNLTLNHLRDIRRRGKTILSDGVFARLVDVAPSSETVTLYRSELRQLLGGGRRAAAAPSNDLLAQLAVLMNRIDPHLFAQAFTDWVRATWLRAMRECG